MSKNPMASDMPTEPIASIYEQIRSDPFSTGTAPPAARVLLEHILHYVEREEAFADMRGLVPPDSLRNAILKRLTAYFQKRDPSLPFPSGRVWLALSSRIKDYLQRDAAKRVVQMAAARRRFLAAQRKCVRLRDERWQAVGGRRGVEALSRRSRQKTDLLFRDQWDALTDLPSSATGCPPEWCRAMDAANGERDRALFDLVALNKTMVGAPDVLARIWWAQFCDDRAFFRDLAAALRRNVGPHRRSNPLGAIVVATLKDLKLPPSERAKLEVAFAEFLAVGDRALQYRVSRRLPKEIQ